MKTKVGQKWYQPQAFLYCLAIDISDFHLKGHYSLKFMKPVSAFNDKKKISFVGSMYS
jgi:hypothetical protein